MGTSESKQERKYSKHELLTSGYIREFCYNKHYPRDIYKLIMSFYIYKVFTYNNDFDKNGIIYYYGEIALQQWNDKTKRQNVLNRLKERLMNKYHRANNTGNSNDINRNNNNNNNNNDSNNNDNNGDSNDDGSGSDNDTSNGNNKLNRYYYEHNNDINSTDWEQFLLNLEEQIKGYNNKWINPNDLGIITIEPDRMIEGNESDLIGRKCVKCRAKTGFTIYLPQYILVKRYTLRHSYGANWLRNWVFEGYDWETNKWDVIKHHKGCDALDKQYKCATFKVKTDKKYNTFQLRHYSNFIGDFFFCSGFEIYGIMTDC